MRLYYSEPSPNNLRKARQHAPSHTHGACWTPSQMALHDVPFFVDNGAFSGAFDLDEWVAALEKAKTEMPRWPDFIVWPDVLDDAEATRELCRSLFDRGAPLLPRRGDFERYVVFQPGLSIDELFAFAHEMAVDGIFLGGELRWKRAHGRQIVARAHDRGLPAHLGNPGGRDGLVWAYRVGFDSADTTTIFQNQYWHWLEDLEEATEETASPPDQTAQRALGEYVT